MAAHAYDRVPTADTVGEEMSAKKEKTTVSVEERGGSSSSSGSSCTEIDTEAEAGFYSAREKRQFAGPSLPSTGLVGAVLALPILLLRITHLSWLIVTRPVRRGLGLRTGPAAVTSGPPAWPAIYQKMGEFRILVPSFLQPVDPNAPMKKMHPTAWLDGMRGMATFFVVWNHSSVAWFNWHIHNGYGINKDEHWLIQLPFLRLIISGPPQVALFFVISGYALSYKPLKLSRMGRFADAYKAIASSSFRRWPRLFFMPIIITFITAFMTYLDLFGTAG
ncbi:hypothetical protein SCUCBS95973_006195 [Sporothrix curviconia]|uniref:Acyltransferase 3 domain-containing protein n=1 Tax=Sporothrix curviconia TaxID=1260050 RepID=A0ABP0C426_9PEZI